MLERFPVARSDFDGPVLITGAGGCIGSWALALCGARASRWSPMTSPTTAPAAPPDGRGRARRVVWRTGDIADGGAVAAVVAEHRVRAIIHLAALQVPFCKADPVAGARANVVGTVNVLEAARHQG